MGMPGAAILKQIGQCLTGSILAIDNLPPFFLPFPIKPEYEDDWNAEFTHATSPGSRYQYPIFTGCTSRTIKFKLQYDADKAGLSRGFNKKDCSEGNKKIRNSFSGGLIDTAEIHSVIAVLESLKLPKQGISTVIADVMGRFVKVQQGTSSPAPPLCILSISPIKMMAGYFTEIKIRPLRRTKWMFVTRFEADCTFLTTPDYIFTNIEDTLRFAYSVASLVFAVKNIAQGNG